MIGFAFALPRARFQSRGLRGLNRASPWCPVSLQARGFERSEKRSRRVSLRQESSAVWIPDFTDSKPPGRDSGRRIRGK
jgi:hypothetical protein